MDRVFFNLNSMLLATLGLTLALAGTGCSPKGLGGGIGAGAGGGSDGIAGISGLGSGNTIAPQEPPVAVGSVVTVLEDDLLTGVLTATDANGDALTFSIVTNPTKGTVMITNASTGAFQYSPNPNVNGADSFTFKARDALADSNVATVSISVTSVEDIPIASSQQITTQINTGVSITLAAIDGDSDALTYSVVTNPANGALTGTAPNLTYTPGLDFAGSDSFTFRVNDGDDFSNTATVSITVADWLDNNWTKRRRLTFRNGAQSENLTDFPVLVVLNSSRINYAETQNSGQDLRFTDTDGKTLLSHEIEKWDENGTSYVWVKVPRIDASSASDSIWMYHGNAAAADGRNPTAVWNANFRAVWHLKEDPSLGARQMADSTSNAAHAVASATMASDDQVAGQAGGSLKFDGAGDELNDDDGEFYVNGVNAFTLSVWVKSNITGTDKGIISAKTPNGSDDVLSLRYDVDGASGGGSNVIKAGITVGGGNTLQLESASGVQTTDWQYIVISRPANGALKIYIDGVLNTPTFNSAARNGGITGATKFLIGKGSKDSAVSSWDGRIDEVRFSNTERSAAWIAADNLSVTDQFIAFGAEASQ
ncbi:MAG: DUF2341 domain-containing protein [Bdellovibrionota bacterium]